MYPKRNKRSIHPLAWVVLIETIVIAILAVSTIYSLGTLKASIDHSTEIISGKSDQVSSYSSIIQDSSSSILERLNELEESKQVLYVDEDNPYTHHDYLLLAATTYCESDGALEESIAISQVIMNRMNDKEVWGDDTLLDVISRENQFAVYSTSPDSKFQKSIRNIEEDDSSLATNAKIAALCALYDIGLYDIPDDVQYFCSYEYWLNVKGESGNWGSHRLYSRIGDTVFFYK